MSSASTGLIISHNAHDFKNQMYCICPLDLYFKPIILLVHVMYSTQLSLAIALIHVHVAVGNLFLGPTIGTVSTEV